jgi:hypothetical protein
VKQRKREILDGSIQNRAGSRKEQKEKMNKTRKKK